MTAVAATLTTAALITATIATAVPVATTATPSKPRLDRCRSSDSCQTNDFEWLFSV